MLKIRFITQKAIAVAIFLSSCLTIFAQDFIILNNGENIRAIVREVGIDYVRYQRFNSQNEGIYRLRKSEISMIMYEDGSRDVFNASSTSAQVRRPTQANQRDNNRYANYRNDPSVQGRQPMPTNQRETPSYYEAENLASKIRIALNGGLSFRAAKIGDYVPSELQTSIKQLRNGYNVGLSAIYYLNETLGTGLIFNNFGSKNDVYKTSLGDAQDKISIFFIGPSFGSRLLNWNKKNGFICNVGIGYLGFYDNASLNSYKIVLQGGTFGMAWDVGYDIGLSENFALGFQLSFISGIMTSYKVKTGYGTQTVNLEKGEHENLSNINLSVGLRFNLEKIR